MGRARFQPHSAPMHWLVMDWLCLPVPALLGQPELEGQSHCRRAYGEGDTHLSVRGVITSLPVLPRYS